MIFHLSYDFDEENRSVNHHTPDEMCSVKYNDLDCAVRNSLKLGFKLLFYGKTDLSNAFRILPANRGCWRWLMMQATDPETGEIKFFFDKNLPFGASISCNLFQRFSNCLKHLIKFFNGGLKLRQVNYLDDFLFIEESEDKCNELVRKFVELCDSIGIPIAEEKTVWGDTKIVFLGILLDGESKTLGVLLDKRNKAVAMLKSFINRRKATVNEMEKWAGFLNFLNNAIFPGCAFTRRMYAKFSDTKLNKQLRKYHHVGIDWEFKEDCKMWLKFLDPVVCTKYHVSRPFVDLSVKRSTQKLKFFSDTSGSISIGGFEARFDRNWIFGKWNPRFMAECRPSIQYLELAALVIAAFCWIERLQNKRVVVHVDNESVKDMLNFTTSGCKRCMRLIRILTLKSLEFNTRIFADHIRSADNKIVDALSRRQMVKFNRLAFKHNLLASPDPLPSEVWPIEKLFEYG